MPDWPVHIIVPLLALLIAGNKENRKYILMLLPLAVIPDLDTFITLHRAFLHNIFIPLLLVLFGLYIKKWSAVFNIAAVYLASHVILDMFGGGVVIFYPIFDQLAFADISLAITRSNELIFIADYGFRQYDPGLREAYGYISGSIGTGAMIFVLLGGLFAAYRDRRSGERAL